jgi:hypothetical protein
MGVSRAWETTGDSMRTLAKRGRGYYELKQHKPQFNKESWRLVNPRKQAKLKRDKIHAKYMEIACNQKQVRKCMDIVTILALSFTSWMLTFQAGQRARARPGFQLQKDTTESVSNTNCVTHFFVNFYLKYFFPVTNVYRVTLWMRDETRAHFILLRICSKRC